MAPCGGRHGCAAAAAPRTGPATPAARGGGGGREGREGSHQKASEMSTPRSAHDSSGAAAARCKVCPAGQEARCTASGPLLVEVGKAEGLNQRRCVPLPLFDRRGAGLLRAAASGHAAT